MDEKERAIEDLEDLAKEEERENYPVSVTRRSRRGFGALVVAGIGVVIGGVALLKRRKKNRNAEIEEPEEDEIDELEVEDLDDDQEAEEVLEEAPEEK